MDEGGDLWASRVGSPSARVLIVWEEQRLVFVFTIRYKEAASQKRRRVAVSGVVAGVPFRMLITQRPRTETSEPLTHLERECV